MDPVVILGTESVSVGPGEQARLTVRVRNQSRRVESYRVDVMGEAVGFARVEPATVSVLPGREGEVDVVFSPPGGAKAPSGSVPFAVRATSEVEASYSAVAEGRLELAGVAGLQMWADNTTASGRWSGKYQLQFANQGNTASRLSVSVRDPALALRLSLERELIELRPGGRATTQVKAKARQPFLRGSTIMRQFQVDCHNVPFGVLPPEAGMAPSTPGDPDHRTLQLTFQHKPVLTKLTLALILLAGVLLIAFAIFQLRKKDELALDVTAPEAPPSFTAEPSGSTSVFLQWGRVPNAVGYQIRRTTNAGELGAEEAALDATAVSHQVDELEAGTEYCFVVIAVGPEGAADSRPTEHQCVTTGTPSALAAPDALVLTPEGGGDVSLQWTHPDQTGVEFAVLVNNTRQPELIVGLGTRITLPQRDTPTDYQIAVQAIRGEETSDPTPAQLVTIEALPIDASTTVAAPPTVPGVTLAPPPPPPPTTAPGGATTLPGATTTTTPITQAQTALQDLPTTPAVFLGPYVPESDGGLPLEQRRNALALTYNVPATDIRVFSNRDTRVRDGVRTGGDLADLPAGDEFFYIAQPTLDAATAFCVPHSARTCGTFTLQGAPSAAVGTTVIVLQRLPAVTPLTDLDERIDELRSQLDRQTVFALDGARFQGFSADEIAIFVSDLGTQQEIDQFCAQRLGGNCSRGVLTPVP